MNHLPTPPAISEQFLEIDGIATNSLTIHGVESLHGGEFTIPSDHIEVGSYIGLAAVTRSELLIENAVPEHMYAVRLMLEKLGVAYEARVVSAHRTPDLLFEYASGAEARGLKVIIAGAGGAAHLPGMCAAKTTLPVLGVPVEVQQRRSLASALLGPRPGLVSVPQPVDQPRGPGLVGREWPGVGESAHRFGREASGLGHAGDDLSELGVEDALELLALGLGERRVEQLAGSALVLVAPLEHRVDADPVEGSSDEVHLPGETHEADFARGLEDDLFIVCING